MKRSLLAAVVVFVIGYISFYFWNKYGAALRTNMDVPEQTQILNKIEKEGAHLFELKDINGELIKLADYKGKVVILNFWASWCDPCVEEFPSMLELIDKFNDKVVMIAISADYTMVDLDDFLKVFKSDKVDRSKRLKIIWDKDKLESKNWGLHALPESFILDKNLKLVKKISGSENWSSAGALKFFESYLKE